MVSYLYVLNARTNGSNVVMIRIIVIGDGNW